MAWQARSPLRASVPLLCSDVPHLQHSPLREYVPPFLHSTVTTLIYTAFCLVCILSERFRLAGRTDARACGITGWDLFALICPVGKE